jgi:hypothetical protein
MTMIPLWQLATNKEFSEQNRFGRGTPLTSANIPQITDCDAGRPLPAPSFICRSFKVLTFMALHEQPH